MTIMKQYKFLALCALIAAAVSCDLTEKPTSFYAKETYFDSYTKAKMAVMGIYDVISETQHYGQWEMALPSSDDTYYLKSATEIDNKRYDIANYVVTSSNQWLTMIWQHKYTGIDRASFAAAGIEGMAGYAENDELKALVAEAKFLRAFFAFDLIKYWGDVPFKTNYSSGYEDAFQPRKPREEIYDAIIDDLTFAKAHLKSGAGLSPETPSKGAAHALMMRVLLQRAGYSLQMDGKMTRPDDATRKTYFDAVITEWEELTEEGYHGFYDDGFVELFKGYSDYSRSLNSKESLWEMGFEPMGDSFADNEGVWGTWNGPEVAAPDAAAGNSDVMGRANAFFRVMPAWKNFFEDTDVRRDVMVCTYMYQWKNGAHVKKENTVDKWYPGKWRREWMPLGFVNPNNVSTNYCPLRYADAVLMAAEAYNETGNTTKALELINLVRARSGATPITLDGNYAELMKAPKVYDLSFISDADAQGKIRTILYWERGFELAFEGQRKYDLIRWNIISDALKLFQDNMDAKLKGKYVAGTNFQTGKHELFPIPLTELQANHKLENKQNPGY